jgi:PAS domain S-box-containing protein
MDFKVRKTAIDIIGDVLWGTHFCQFYETREDLIEILVPYFKAGLENNEFCMWITSEPLRVEDAITALKKQVPNLDDYINRGQIEILDYSQWYTKPGYFDPDKVLEGWIEKKEQALKKGFEGLRLTGDTFWLENRDWKKFTEYEAAVNSMIGQHQMLVVCTYSLDKCSASEIVDVVSNHRFALVKRQARWEIIGSAEYQNTVEALRESQRQLSIRNKIVEIFLTIPDDEMYGAVLEVLLETMESKYGIFGYIDEQGRLIIPSMTRDIWEKCRIPDKTIVFPRDKWGGIWGRALKEKKSLYSNEGLHAPEGHVPITRVLVVPVMYGGQVIGILGVADKPTDYSLKDLEFLESIAGKIAPILNARLQRDREERERKQAEEALKRSEERYTLAQQAANIGSWDWDIKTGALAWSFQIEPMFGFGREEFGATYDAFLECVHPDDRQHVVNSVQACVEKGKDYSIEHRIIWPDGTIRWLSETGDVVRDEEDKAIRMLGIVQDITDRKERESQQQLVELVLERLNQKGSLPDLIRDVIKLIKDSIGFEAVGVRLREDDDFPYFEVNGFSNDFVEAENYLCARNKKGEQIYDEEGQPILSCMCGSVITGRTDPALPFFTDGGSFWTNSTTEIQNSPDLGSLRISLRNHCNEAGYESVALVPLRSGDEIVGLLQLNDSRPVRFTPETVRFFEGIGASIGIALARIKAEENIYNLAKFPSENPSPVLRIAKEGTVLYANAAGSEILKTWECNVGERVPEYWHKYVLRILKSGSNEELEVKCGERVFSLIMAPITDAGYVNVYGTDITGRKLAEENLEKYRQHLEELVETRTAELTQANIQLLEEIEARKLLEKEILNISEQERRKIGQELHDSLGQQLTGVAFMTKVLEKKLAGKSLDEAVDVTKIATLVNQATEQARGLARGLDPIDLETGTLMSALQELATSTEALFGIHCVFKCDKPIEIDDTEAAVHLYRIAQEALTNAIKHGKAKNIQIGLTRRRNKYTMTIRNDGLDFPKEFEARGTGMGLQIMDHRIDIIGGSLDIRKAAEGGTIVTCTFPNKKH